VRADPDESTMAFPEGSAIAVRYWRAHLLREARPGRVNLEAPTARWLTASPTPGTEPPESGRHPRRSRTRKRLLGLLWAAGALPAGVQ
jgi:hypothetical protein